MVEIATYCCKDRTEARIKENEHYNELQASLNSCQPYVNKLNYLCSICNLQFTSVMKYNYHVDYCTKYYKKYCEKNNIGENDIGENNINEEICDNSYNCNLCNYSTNKKSNYERHLLSSKHKKNSNEINNVKVFNCDICDKLYNTRSALWKHNNRKHLNKKLTKEDKDQIIIQLLKQNTELIKKQQDTIDKLVKNSVENTM